MRKLKDEGWAVWDIDDSITIGGVWPWRKTAIVQFLRKAGDGKDWPYWARLGYRCLRTVATATPKARGR